MKKLWLVLLIGMLVLTGCGKKEEPKEDPDANSTASVSSEGTAFEDLEDEYDIIIVGAGGAGLAAAIQAHDQGAKVVVFEKTPIIGGNTLKSSGGMNASETKFQKEQGIEDSNDTFYDDTLKGGKEMNDPELLRYFVDNSAGAIDWLDSMGITLNNISFSGGASVKRIHRPADGSAVGPYLVDGLTRNVKERNIPLFLQADVKEVIQKDNKVDGVKVVFYGEKERTISGKVVILTTGGFGANEEMVTSLRPELANYVTTNAAGTTGDGIVMAEKLGAAVVDMKEIQIHPTVDQKHSILLTEGLRGDGAILVNQEGNRFFNELSTRDKVSQAIIDLPEHYSYLIADDALAKRVTQMEYYKEQGLVEEGATIAELAEKIGVPAANLEATLTTWNAAVESGVDTEFGRETGMDYKLDTPKYYAIKIAPGIHHTMGGVKINTKTEVINTKGDVIPGLYAAGELTGGLHGGNRIGGNAVADIIIFGRQAGQQASDFVK
ncbi:flavocytochrome c [Erysipelothrix sp. HDW6C]|uniref:flavocytochrome c n=1 Tax=Erysipelothrix sp. HDW6C TaxID=2714930 RepID=UPI00140D85BD|nr:flavocytochrome c [Erysipelothrix sp. HDW6C]QIK70551.1 flavocytochrome c [Erysipelothrix sp. HDW6C]